MNELRVTVDRLTRDSKTGLMVDVCASKTELSVTLAARTGSGFGV